MDFILKTVKRKLPLYENSFVKATAPIILVRKNKTFVIAGKKGSTAQTYAKKNGFRFLNNTAAVRTAKMTGVPKTKTILRGKTYTIQAVTVPYYSDEKILFRSSDRRIATVNSKGVVKGIRKGTAVITVQSGAKKLNCKITVK